MMRSVIFLALLLSITACMVKCAWGAECTLQWDANTEPGVITYRIYRGLELLGETTATTLTVHLPNDQPSILTATARNEAGIESLHSLPLKIVTVPVRETLDLGAGEIISAVHRLMMNRAFYKLDQPLIP